MPQAARANAKTQDKESKRARGAMSCAECRRLKLKCDKTVPCSSCKRRGCSEICPNGSLITGQGTRFVLADTEKLHRKIAQMSDRIRLLEDALAVLQSTLTVEPHPLLSRDLLRIKSSIELHSAIEGAEDQEVKDEIEESQYIDAFGTLAIRDDGAATFYGRSAGSESLLIGEPSNSQTDSPQSRRTYDSLSPWGASLPPSIAQLSGSFPLSSGGLAGVTLEYLVESFLPPWSEAWRLCSLYLEQAPWFFGAVTKTQLFDEILPLWYSEAKTSVSSLPRDSHGPAPPMDDSNGKGGAHELALLFVIFCFGTLTDVSQPPAPDSPNAERYFRLTRAALTLEPVLDRPPAVTTVQTLSLMAIYQGLCSGDNSIESTWALMGLATKLAQSIGLHRDCARWKLSPVEVQKRRALFWEIFITDCWQSLATGRLATFYLPYVDCELPLDPDATMTDDGTVQPSFSAWKARFGKECVSAVVRDTLTSRAPKYSKILDLDRKIRDIELPPYAQGAPPKGVGLAQTMSHFMPGNYRELTLLYVHRCFFAHAITSHPNDPLKSPYGPSFLAGYRSACELLDSVQEQFEIFPVQIARFWVLWTHGFSAVVMLASVVTHGPMTKVAYAALTQLTKARDLFSKAAELGGRAVKFLPIIERLHVKAQQAYRDTHNGAPPSRPNDLFTPSTDVKDELSIFSGRTHTVSVKANSPMSPAGSTQSHGADKSRTASAPSSPDYSPPPASFAGVHPILVDQLHGFESHLNTQIQNAYYSDRDAFPGPSMDHQHQYHSLRQQHHSSYNADSQQSYIHPTPHESSHAFHQFRGHEPMPSSTPQFSEPVTGHGGQWSGPDFYYPDAQAVPQHHQPHTQQHYAEDFHGIPADDYNLQERWTTFMSNVAPFPR